MELAEFVQQTIEQIVTGVISARESIREQGGDVNPIGSFASHQLEGRMFSHKRGFPQDVEFDVALTQTERTGSKSGIGVFFAGVGLGTKGESAGATEAMTRVRFSVPILLPAGENI